MDKISFNGKLHFLQNQTGLVCAICGKKMFSEVDLKQLRQGLEHLKGAELAQKLSSYVDYYGEKCNLQPLLQMTELAQKPQNALLGIKNIALMLKEGKIYSSDFNVLVRNLFDSVMYSADHVIPRSNGGINSYANFIPTHRACNSDRGSLSYKELIAANPKIVENIKKAINFIQARINSDKAGLTRYKINIPEDFSQKIAEAFASQGVNPSFITLG